MKNLLLLVALFVMIPVVVNAQANKDLSVDERAIYARIMLIELQPDECLYVSKLVVTTCTDQISELSDLYARAVRYPKLIERLTAEATQALYVKPNPKASARLAALEIVQNQRIIELLELMLKKPR